MILYPIEVAGIMKQLLVQENESNEIDYFEQLKTQRTKEETMENNEN